LHGHTGKHDSYSSEVWDFFEDRDKNKLAKAGFATPRGGSKGGYQNHVVRSNKVIIPYERLADVDTELFEDGYIIRLLPEQYFQAPNIPRPEFTADDATVVVGRNAFVLYRTHESFRAFPPLQDWTPRSLMRGKQHVNNRRGNVEDVGEYVLRLSRIGTNQKRFEGPPQGIFATEYADKNTNYLCKCVLAWLTIQTSGSPYTLTQAGHLRAVLRSEGLDDANEYERRGVLRHGICCCPLCTRFIRYSELHDIITFQGEGALANAAAQVEGATRSTVVNLFHLSPLVYNSLTHVPANIAWGHAVCNTRLGQRKCYSLAELQEMDLKVGIVREEGIETFGWISQDWQMIRSRNGAVWIQLNGDVEEGPPAEPGAFDTAEDLPESGGND
jgi:hypothetical protein